MRQSAVQGQARSSRLAPIMIGTSSRISWRETTSGAIRAVRPRMNSTLKILLPTTLPMARSVLPSSTACTLTAVSGALVPKATMVRPTTSGLMPNDSGQLGRAAHQHVGADDQQDQAAEKYEHVHGRDCSYQDSPTAGCNATRATQRSARASAPRSDPGAAAPGAASPAGAVLFPVPSQDPTRVQRWFRARPGKAARQAATGGRGRGPEPPPRRRQIAMSRCRPAPSRTSSTLPRPQITQVATVRPPASAGAV